MFSFSFPFLTHPMSSLTHPLWTRRQAGLYCVCFYRQFSQGKLGSFRKRGGIRKFLFWVTTALCNAARFQSSPTDVQSHSRAWLAIAHGGEEGKGAAGLLTKACGGQVSMWQHLELKCLVVCMPPAMAQPFHPPQVCCRGANTDGKLAAMAMSPPPAFFPLSCYPKHAHVGEWVSTAPPALRGMAMPTHTYFRTLGTVLFPSLFPNPAKVCCSTLVSLDYRRQMDVWFQRTGQTPFLASLCASC